MPESTHDFVHVYGTLRKVISLLDARERAVAVLLVGAMLVGAILEMVAVGAIPVFVAALSDPEAVGSMPLVAPILDWLDATTGARTVPAVGFLLVAVYVLKSVALVGLAQITNRYVVGRQVAIARRLFTAYLAKPYLFHLERNSTELIRNVGHSAMGVGSWALQPTLQLAMEVLTLTTIVLLLLVVEPFSSIAALMILGVPAMLFMRVVRRRTVALGEAEHREREAMLRALTEGLHGIQTARVLGLEDHFFRKFESASAGFGDAATRRAVLWELPRPILETVVVAGLLAIALLLLFTGRALESLVPTLTLLAVAAIRLIPSMTRILTALNWIRFAKPSVDAVHGDLAGDEAPPAATAPFDRIGTIRLEDVHFEYPGSRGGAIHDITLAIEPGEAVGVVGPTGSGKSTLVSLILGLLEPDAGRVTIGGMELKGRERAWRGCVGFVPQDIYLLDTTIRRNVAFGLTDEEIDEEAVWKALDAAGIRPFVEGLPEGPATIVGERGVRLSGGQRQRIGIARALYYDPSVLVMDEATSALDDTTERIVMEAIDAMKGDRTLIIVAHRSSTVAGCDRLVRLDEGRQVVSSSASSLT